MARKIISEVCGAVKVGGGISDLDEICRYVVAQEMEREDRVLRDDEIEGIVEDIVEQEDIVDPESTIDEDGIANITDTEWENIDDSIKVIDSDGDDAIIVDGHVHKVSLSKDTKAQYIASNIITDINATWSIIAMTSGVNIDMASYQHAGSMDTVCPECGSENQTPVWYDDEEQYVYCNDCGNEYTVQLNPSEATTEEITTEDYTIFDDGETSVFGTLFYDGELGWTWQVWENGECIKQDIADDPEEIIDIFDSIKREYEDIEPDEVLKDTETGMDETVIEVTSSIVRTNIATHSRAKLAVALFDNIKFADKSEVYEDEVEIGDVYTDDYGNEIEVVDDDGDITYLENKMDDRTGAYRSEYMSLPRHKFISMLDKDGYILS